VDTEERKEKKTCRSFNAFQLALQPSTKGPCDKHELLDLTKNMHLYPDCKTDIYE